MAALTFCSTLGSAPVVDLETAVLLGKPDDGGLFVPEELPLVSIEELQSWRGYTYPELAVALLRHFINDSVMPRADLVELVRLSFAPFTHPEVIPHHALDDQLVVQELFHGPTLSFKDVAMGFVVNLFDYFLRRRGERRTLMVATSGDTGPAAAHASVGKEALATWVFFPTGLITDEQVRQMTTILAPNVHAVAVNDCRNGSDDLDDLIAGCFADDVFREEMGLSSVNSINWARVMTQIIHYFYGYLRYAKKIGDPVHFSVPCGAFGNMCAGAMARRMGLPVGKMIVANNANVTLSRVLETGRLDKLNIKNTLASAIDIAVPMNFWRHLYFSADGDTDALQKAWNEYEATGSVTFPASLHESFRAGFLNHTVSDELTLATIREVWSQNKYLLDPHGAVAVAAAKHFRKDLAEASIVCLATAHPAKFPAVTRQAIGHLPAAGGHASLEANAKACERKYSCDFATMHAEIPRVMREVSAALTTGKRR